MSNIFTFRQSGKPTGDSAWGKLVTIRSVMRTAALLAAIAATGVPGSSQSIMVASQRPAMSGPDAITTAAPYCYRTRFRACT